MEGQLHDNVKKNIMRRMNLPTISTLQICRGGTCSPTAKQIAVYYVE